MTDETDNWPKPRFPFGSKEQIHALGVIAAAYNQLEFSFLHLFIHYTGLAHLTAQHLFANLSNNLRLDLFRRCVEDKEKDPQVKDSALHFADCFDICAENRNVAMHAMVGQSPDGELLHLAKATKGDPKKVNTYSLTLQELRAIADEITGANLFGTWLFVCLTVGVGKRIQSQVPGFQDIVATLPGKPPLPRKLTTPLPKDPKDEPLQPRS